MIRVRLEFIMINSIRKSMGVEYSGICDNRLRMGKSTPIHEMALYTSLRMPKGVTLEQWFVKDVLMNMFIGLPWLPMVVNFIA